MQLFGAALALVSLLAVTPVTSAESRLLRVIVNDSEVSFSISPEIRSGVLFVPLVPLASAFGASATWDAAARIATVKAATGVVLRLTVGDPGASVDGVRFELPAPPVMEEGTVLVPAVAVLKALGAYVKVSEADGVVEAVSQVTDVTWKKTGGVLVVKVSTTGPVRAQVRALHAPDRLVVDLASAVTKLRKPEVEIGDGDFLRMRTAQFQVHPYVTRLVFDLVRPFAFRVDAGSWGVTVRMGPETAVAAASIPPASSPATPSTAGDQSAAGPSGVPRGAREEASSSAATSTPERPLAPEPLAQPPLPEFEDRPGAFHVRGIAYNVQDGVGQVTISASKSLTYTVHQFVFPDRLAIDLPGGVFRPRRQDLEVGSDMVRNVVVSQLQLQPNLTRVVIHLRHKAAYTVTPIDGGRGLTVALADKGRAIQAIPGSPRGPAVIIDPGHGGADAGAIGPTGLREADVTLSIGRMAQQALERQGVRTVLTRTDNTTVELEERPDIARRSGGVVFISIHANAGRDPLASGTETYYRSPESQALAALLQAEVAQALGEPDRGVRNADFYVLVNTPMPAALVEVAFISNAKEEAMLRDPAAQRHIAEAIARAVAKFLATHPQAAQPQPMAP